MHFALYLARHRLLVLLTHQLLHKPILYSLIHRYGPLSPPLFFFLMGIIGKGKMCRK